MNRQAAEDAKSEKENIVSFSAFLGVLGGLAVQIFVSLSSAVCYRARQGMI